MYYCVTARGRAHALLCAPRATSFHARGWWHPSLRPMPQWLGDEMQVSPYSTPEFS